MQKKCLVCGKELGRNKYFCSQKCRSNYLRNMKTCVVCGKKFYAAPSSGKITCSTACEKENRKRETRNNPEYMKNLEKAHEAFKTNPNTSGETHSNAKSWILLSPTGERFEINNLKLWCRQNEDILPSTPEKFYDGISKVKSTLIGTCKKNKIYHYKGWKIENFFDENKARANFPPRKERKPREKMSDEERLRRRREHAKKAYQEKTERRRNHTAEADTQNKI